MDLRTEIMGAIDRLQARCRPVDAADVARETRSRLRAGSDRVPGELRAMSKAGLVVYDRKASGWRRA